MKFLKFLLVASLTIGGSQFMQSCGDDEPDVEQTPGDVNNPEQPGDPENPDNPEQPGDLPDNPSDINDPVAPSRDEKPSDKSPEQSKESLEATGIKAANTFKPEDQKVVTDFAQEFNDMFDGFEMPTQWDIYGDDETFEPQMVVRNIGRASIAPTVANLTRATQIYVLEFAKFTGVFEPSNNEWNKVSDSDDIIFRYSNRAGHPVVIRLTASGSNDQFTIEDEYDGEEYRINPPRRVNLTVTQNGTSLVDCTVDAIVSETGHTVNATAQGRIANIEFTSITEATDSKVMQKSLLSVDGKSVIASSAVVNGSNLANRSSIENLIDHPTAGRFDAMFKNAIANIDVLGEAQVRATGSKVGDIINAFDTEKWWDNSDYDSKDAARADCQKACDVANNNVLARLYLNGSKDYDATVNLVPVLEEENYGDYGWWEWYTEPMLIFNDNTSYTFAGYFGNNRFESVADTWSALWDSYTKLWR